MQNDDQDAGSQELVRNERIEHFCLRNLLASTNQAIYFKDRKSRFLLVSRGVVQHHVEARHVPVEVAHRAHVRGRPEDVDAQQGQENVIETKELHS